MIDIQTETVVTFAEASKHLPKRRAGKRPCVATLYRWAQNGVRGIRLETLQIAGTRCTSLESLQRFFNQLSGDDSAPPQTTRGRKKQIARAESELAAAGIA